MAALDVSPDDIRALAAAVDRAQRRMADLRDRFNAQTAGLGSALLPSMRGDYASSQRQAAQLLDQIATALTGHSRAHAEAADGYGRAEISNRKRLTPV